VRQDGETVYDLLRANRFEEAKDAVKTWRVDNPIRCLVEGEDYQTAICDLGKVLFPQDGSTTHYVRGEAMRFDPLPALERALF